MKSDLKPEALAAARQRFADTGDIAEALSAYLQNSLEDQLIEICEAKKKRAEKYFGFEENERGKQEMQEVFIFQQMHARVTFMEQMAHRYYKQLKELGVLAP